MKAIILAAGLGTRLFPLTKDKPKAMVQVQGKPLLQHQLEKLKKAGFTHVLINVHHFADQIIDFLNNNNNFGLDIQISDERNHLLDTGGALRKAADFIRGSDSVLVHNVDVLTTISIKDMLHTHKLSGAIATLAIRRRETARYLLFNKQNQLCAWENIKTGEKKGDWSDLALERGAFSGIHILSPLCADLFPDADAFSVIDFYLDLIQSNTVMGYYHDESDWLDVGKPESLAEAEKLLL